MRRIVMLAMLWFGAASCRRDDAVPSAAPSTSAPAGPLDPSIAGQIAALGTDGVVVVVAHPGHWAALRGGLARVFGETHPWRRAVEGEADLHEGLLHWVARLHADHDQEPEPEPPPEQEAPPEQAPARPPKNNPPHCLFEALGNSDGALAGVDHSRPIVASLFEAPVQGPHLAVVAALAPSSRGFDGLRHQVLLPATDPVALVAALEARLATAMPFPELVHGQPDARAWQVGADWIALFPGPDHVRLVAVTRALGVTRAALLDRGRARLHSTTTPLPDTPALRAAIDPSQGLALLVRPWLLRTAIEWDGLSYLEEAIATIGLDRHGLARARGTSIVARGIGMIDDTDPEFDDWALTLRGQQDALHVRAVASLTPTGRRVLEAAAKPTENLRIAVGSPVAQLSLGFDVAAALGAATPQRTIAASSKPEAVESMDYCGRVCMAHQVLRQPVGSAKAWLGIGATAPKDAARLIGAQLVVTDARPEKLAGALALRVSTKVGPADAEALAAALGVFRDTPLQAHAATHEGQGLLLLGLRVDPRTVFDLSAARVPGSALAEIDLHAELWREKSNGLRLPPRARLRARSARASDALVHDAVIAFDGTAALATAPALAGLQWQSPIVAQVATAGTQCLASAAAPIGKFLEALMSDGGAEPRRVVQGLGSVLATLDCAMQEPATAATAAELARLVTLTSAAIFERSDLSLAVGVLEGECARGKDAEVCARHQDWRERPQPKLITAKTLEGSCQSDGYGVGIQIVVAKSSAWIEGRRVALDAKMIADALAELSPLSGPAAEHPTVGILAAADVDAFATLPVLEGVSRWGATSVGVMVRVRDDADYIRVGLAFGSPKSRPAAPDKPRAKSGLYAMRNGNDAIPQMGSAAIERWVHVGREGIRVRPLSDGVLGTQTRIADATALGRDDDRGRFTGTALRIEAGTSWSQLVAVLLATCPAVTITDQPPPG